METDGVLSRRLVGKTGKVDRLSNLPESLLIQVLLNLPTKDVIKCSVLSNRWRNLWKIVPGLELSYGHFVKNDFADLNSFASFVDSFLEFNAESCLENFKLVYNENYPDTRHLPAWIETVVSRKVKHLHVMVNSLEGQGEEVEIPLSVYTCKSLVSLKLRHVFLPHPKFVSLPCVKALELDCVIFANDSAFEKLISSCPALESLALCRTDVDNLIVLRVCSQSLLSFTLDDVGLCYTDGVIAIDAPRLKYLKLFYVATESIMMNYTGSLVKADMDMDMDITINPLQRKMIGNILVGICNVKHMVIYSTTLEVIFNYSRCEGLRLPLFRNLSSLVVNFRDDRWEMLPVLLESCPNLKFLDLKFWRRPWEDGDSVLAGPQRLLTSLEYVKITEPMKDEATEMELVSYFLTNSTSLKRFSLCLADFRKNGEFVFLKKLLTIPRLSPSCQVVVL